MHVSGKRFLLTRQRDRMTFVMKRAMLAGDPWVSVAQMKEATGWSRNNTRSNMENLVKAGLARRSGKRGKHNERTRYKLTERGVLYPFGQQ